MSHVHTWDSCLFEGDDGREYTECLECGERLYLDQRTEEVRAHLLGVLVNDTAEAIKPHIAEDVALLDRYFPGAWALDPAEVKRQRKVVAAVCRRERRLEAAVIGDEDDEEEAA